MIKCPTCHKNTKEDIGRCQYCNSELFRGFLGKLIGKSSDNAVAEKKNNDLGSRIKRMGSSLEITAPKQGLRMVVIYFFNIKGRGSVLVGKIQSGAVKVNDHVVLTAKNGENMECLVKEIEAFRKKINEAKAGDTVGLLLCASD